MSSTSYLDPNGDASITWGGTPSASKIDDAVRQPTATGFDGLTIIASDSSDNLQNVYDLTNPVPASDTVSTLTIWLRVVGDFGFRVRLIIGGSPLTQSGESGSGPGWVSYTYSGLSYVGSNLDSAQLGIATPVSISKGNDADVEEAYVEVTHAASGALPGSAFGSKVFAGKIFASPIFGLQVPRSRPMWIPKWGVLIPRTRRRWVPRPSFAGLGKAV